MTPTERHNDYWRAQLSATGETLTDFFLRCHNEAIEQAAKRVMHCEDRAAILRMKY